MEFFFCIIYKYENANEYGGLQEKISNFIVSGFAQRPMIEWNDSLLWSP